MASQHSHRKFIGDISLGMGAISLSHRNIAKEQSGAAGFTPPTGSPGNSFYYGYISYKSWKYGGESNSDYGRNDSL